MTRLLIVEDERLVARELRLRLEDQGYEVTGTVASAEAALQAATARVPDLVLMDIRIEGSRDGIEAAALLQRAFDIPVVFLSAHSDEATVQRAKLLGAAGYLMKPPKERELIVAIEVALHRHELARQLRAREKWFSTTLRSIGDAVISTDTAGNIAFMNPVAETLTGWRSEEARGLPAATVVQLERATSAESPLAETIRRKETIHVDGMLTDRTGRRRAIADSASPIVDEAGSLLGGVLVLRDVTDQRALERQLEASERLASLGTLAAGIAHELNNPLTWVIANLTEVIEALAQPLPETARAALHADAIEALEGADRIRRIVRDLSVFSRPPAERDHCQVEVAIREAIARTTSPVEITCASQTLEVAIAEPRLVQVLANLLANAVRAVENAPPRLHQIALRVTRLEAAARIDVEDSGEGIAEDARLRVFEPFFTTKPSGRGTGLGLSIAHGLIAAAGGTLQLARTSPAGTTFVVTLPLAKQPVERDVRSATFRGRILAVDDEEPMRRLIPRILGKHDVEATSATEALRRLLAGERYDLILCDLMMPDLSGMELHAAVLELAPEQARRMVFVTGGAANIRSTEFLAASRQPVVEKPFRPGDLVAFVDRLLATLPRRA